MKKVDDIWSGIQIIIIIIQLCDHLSSKVHSLQNKTRLKAHFAHKY